MSRALLFVSTRFPFPVDSGGKIRTTQILRGLKGGSYEVTLISPATDAQRHAHAAGIRSICDRFAGWTPELARRLPVISKALSVCSSLPIPVAVDRSRRGRRVVRAKLAAEPDIVVFDFPHSAVLAPPQLNVPSVLFTHNVEAEIFRRHAAVSSGPKSLLWRNQFRKMVEFERRAMRRFDTVVAVSHRDAEAFASQYSAENIEVIGTGVDHEYFAYSSPPDSGQVVFTGSMDWLANQDGISFLLDEVWPLVLEKKSRCAMTVVGRAPPGSLVRKAEQARYDWRFTGYVEDVRSFVRAASVYVIPLRVAGGTRLKVYEAMAMGCPVVSTPIGVEGLPVVPGEHYLHAETATELADGIVRLLDDRELRLRLSIAARRFVESNCTYRAVARQFEEICDATLQRAMRR